MSTENTLVDHLLSHVDVKHRICGFAGGYAAAALLARLSKEALPLTETYLRRVTDRGEFLWWQSKSEYEQTEVVRHLNDAVCKARVVGRRVAQLKAEERKKFDAAFSDFDKIEERFANAATDKGDELVLACGARAKVAKKFSTNFKKKEEVQLLSACKWGEKDAVVKIDKSEIKPECLVPQRDTINNSACGGEKLGCWFEGKVTSRSLSEHRRKLEKLVAGIEERCVVAVTYGDFRKGHPAFKALCEAAPTEAARLTYIAARARDVGFLPSEKVVERKKCRLAPLVKEIADVAGDGYSKQNGENCVSRWAEDIVDRAEAQLAMRPVAERRAELVRRRRWAYSEPRDVNKQRKLYEQIKVRASAIDPGDYPFTPMDAAAREAACEIERSLWSAPEGRRGRSTVASHRFQLPLCRSFDLGHLADALRDGLSFLIPTSAIEAPSPEQHVASMEIGARRFPHLYPPLGGSME